MQSIYIFLTGCNRGLGRDILHLLATKNPNYHVVGTMRKGLKEFKSQIDKQYPENNIQILPLEIASNQSIQQLYQYISSKQYRFDALINNGALGGGDHGKEIPSVQWATDTFNINVKGTINLTNRILPFLKPKGRIINVSSRMGGLDLHQPNVKEKFQKQGLTNNDIFEAADEYVNGCKNKDLNGYYPSAYGTSKMFLNYWSRFILSKQITQGQMIVSMSPGHCKTDMGGQKAPRTSMEGATYIYNHLWGEYHYDKFYHSGMQTDFQGCHL